ncbi:MAG: DNA-primase RepB domain-containing protein [Anaeromyxobacteraceae bacterium]
MVVCHLGPDGMKGFTIDASDSAARAKGAEIACAYNRKGEQLYFSVNAPAERVFKKPSKAEIGAARFAHVEIDPDAFMAQKGGYSGARSYLHEIVAAEMAASPAPPTVVWSSGNGISALWRLAEPVEHADVEHLNRRLVARWGGDPGTHNVDRILRLAGTVNHPTKKKMAKGYPKVARLAAVLHADAGARYTIAQLSDGLPEPVPEESPRAPREESFTEETAPLDEGERLALAERFDALRAADVLLEARWQGRGTGLGDDSRSGLDMSLGSMLKARGLSYRETRHLLISYPHGAGAEKAKAGEERYFQRIYSRTGSGVSLEEVRRALVELALDANERDEPLATEAWAKVVYDAHLDPVGLEDALTFVVEKLNIGKKRAITNAWKVFFAERSASYKAARSKDRLTLVAKDRAPVLWNPMSYNSMLPQVEAALIEDGLLRIDRAYVRVAKDEIPNSEHPDNAHRSPDDRLPPPKQVLFVPHTKVSMLLAIEKSVCLYRRGEKGAVVPMEVPFDKLPTFMLDLPDKRAPRVTGLVLHPVHTPSGRLLSGEGLDDATGLFLSFDGWRFPQVKPAPTRDEAVAAAHRIRELLFAEVLLQGRRGGRGRCDRGAPHRGLQEGDEPGPSDPDQRHGPGHGEDDAREDDAHRPHWPRHGGADVARGSGRGSQADPRDADAQPDDDLLRQRPGWRDDRQPGPVAHHHVAGLHAANPRADAGRGRAHVLAVRLHGEQGRGRIGPDPAVREDRPPREGGVPRAAEVQER